MQTFSETCEWHFNDKWCGCDDGSFKALVEFFFKFLNQVCRQSWNQLSHFYLLSMFVTRFWIDYQKLAAIFQLKPPNQTNSPISLYSPSKNSQTKSTYSSEHLRQIYINYILYLTQQINKKAATEKRPDIQQHFTSPWTQIDTQTVSNFREMLKDNETVSRKSRKHL